MGHLCEVQRVRRFEGSYSLLPAGFWLLFGERRGKDRDISFQEGASVVMRHFSKSFSAFLLGGVLAMVGGCGGDDPPSDGPERPGRPNIPPGVSMPDDGPSEEPNAKAPTTKAHKIAFVTNNTSAFWTIAQAGVHKAEEELGIKVTFTMPPNGTVLEQQQYLENFVAQGYDAVAISPIDAENMTPLLDKISDRIAVFCHDSDAPESKRLGYVGTNNYLAGRRLGERLVKALPDGGKIAVFVGTLDAQNAKDRRQGIHDVIKESGVDIQEVATKLDETDRARAKQNVEDVLASIKDVDVLVGLWSYNGPIIASALKGAGKVGEIKAMCFDHDAETLTAVSEGVIEFTVVQQPYVFGYDGVKMMVDYLENGAGTLPEGGVMDIPVRVIDPDNVDEFSAELAELTKGG